LVSSMGPPFLLLSLPLLFMMPSTWLFSLKCVRQWALRSSLVLGDLLIHSSIMFVVPILDRRALYFSVLSFDCLTIAQIEVAKNIWDLLEGSTFAQTHETEHTISEDEGTLRQDRYPLRTAPQFIGPQIEDLLESLRVITTECNSSKLNLKIVACLS